MLARIINKSTYLRIGAFHLMVFVVTRHALRISPYCQSVFGISGEGGNPLQMGCVLLRYCTNAPFMIMFLYCINALWQVWLSQEKLFVKKLGYTFFLP